MRYRWELIDLNSFYDPSPDLYRRNIPTTERRAVILKISNTCILLLFVDMLGIIFKSIRYNIWYIPITSIICRR